MPPRPHHSDAQMGLTCRDVVQDQRMTPPEPPMPQAQRFATSAGKTFITAQSGTSDPAVPLAIGRGGSKPPPPSKADCAQACHQGAGPNSGKADHAAHSSACTGAAFRRSLRHMRPVPTATLGSPRPRTPWLVKRIRYLMPTAHHGLPAMPVQNAIIAAGLHRWVLSPAPVITSTNDCPAAQQVPSPFGRGLG